MRKRFKNKGVEFAKNRLTKNGSMVATALATSALVGITALGQGVSLESVDMTMLGFGAPSVVSMDTAAMSDSNDKVFSSNSAAVSNGLAPSLTNQITISNDSKYSQVEITEGMGDYVYVLDSKNKTMEISVSVQTQGKAILSGEELDGVFSRLDLTYFDAEGNPTDEFIDNEGALDEDGNPVGDGVADYGGVQARFVMPDMAWVDKFYDYTADPISEEYVSVLTYYRGVDTWNEWSKLTRFPLNYNYPPHIYKAELSFMDNTPQYAWADVTVYAGYEYYWSNTSGKIEAFYESANNAVNNKVSIMNSNLEWSITAEPITGEQKDGETLWQQFNYQDVILTLSNDSVGTEPYMDAFEFHYDFKAQEVTEFKQSNMLMWAYDADNPTDPIWNDMHSEASLTSAANGYTSFVGVYEGGGMLVYDITDIPQEDLDVILSEEIYDREELGDPLPYVYSGYGKGAIRFAVPDGEESGLGTLFSKEYVETIDPTAHHERKVLVRIPYSNVSYINTLGISTSYTSSYYNAQVEIGLGDNPIKFYGEEQGNYQQEFVKQEIDGYGKKAIDIDDDGYEIPMSAGVESWYSIGELQNKSNLPMYSPYIIDTLPEGFQLTDIQYTFSRENVEKIYKINESESQDFIDNLEIDKILDLSNPVEIELVDKDGTLAWFPVDVTVTEDTANATAGERLFTFDGFSGAIETYLYFHESSPLYDPTQDLDWAFTGNFKINFMYPFSEELLLDPPLTVDEYNTGLIEYSAWWPNDYIPGHVMVYGIPYEIKRIINSVDLMAIKYNFYDVLYEEEWVKEEVLLFEFEHDSWINPPEPWTMTQGLTDDGYVRVEDETVKATMNEETSGYTVRMGSNNRSIISPGTLAMDVPVLSEYPAPFNGLTVNSVLITEDMMEDMLYPSIVFTLYNGTTVEYKWRREDGDPDDLVTLQDMLGVDGELLFTPEHWQVNMPDGVTNTSVYNLVKVEINFISYEGNTIEPTTEDEIDDYTQFVQFLGRYDFPGTLEMNSTVTTSYENFEGTIVTLEDEDPGYLLFMAPDIRVDVYSHYETQMDIEEVIGDLIVEEAGYSLHLSSTDAKIVPGYIDMAMPSLFESTKITITADMLTNMNYSHTGLNIQGTGTSMLELTADQVNQFLTGNGDIVIVLDLDHEDGDDRVLRNESGDIIMTWQEVSGLDYWTSGKVVTHVTFYFDSYQDNTGYLYNEETDEYEVADPSK